jgi:ParB family chromosome partitioning protein
MHFVVIRAIRVPNPQHKIDKSPALRQSAPMSKSALGRGLGALMGNPLPTAATVPSAQPAAPAVADTRERVQNVPLNRIRPSALQPRKQFSEESLKELADSIREQGIVQPLIVRPRGEFFELIAGERRWRAAQLLHLPEVPVIAREADDRTVLELALIENLQRENLNPIEEAHGYAQLAEQFQLTQEEISTKVGKSRAVVANALRLLKLPQAVQNLVREGRLTVGHAKVILSLSDEKIQTLAADRIVKEALNVRQTEGLVAKLQSPGGKEKAGSSKASTLKIGDPHVADLEARLREMFATKVKLNYSEGKGSLEISFFSNEELERILQILGVST